MLINIMHRLRKFLIRVLIKWLGKLQEPDNQKEYEERLEQLRTLFHQTLPTLDEKWQGKAIIEGGTFNYFVLPSGSLPKYDFSLPEIPLYVIVGDIRSANWDFANRRGISREEWEAYHADLDFLERSTLDLATIGKTTSPRIVIIKWDEPINHLRLSQKFMVEYNV